ncbi:DUF4027 family protein [Bacillus sp. DX4.1]|nr:DUF4027 family protein [Bacillus sp. DX4.1]MDM5187126.1 DUF4027 family protein [Bacillus sp. DX4.1]
MKEYQDVVYSQIVSVICLGGFVGSILLAITVKLFQQLFL